MQEKNNTNDPRGAVRDLTNLFDEVDEKSIMLKNNKGKEAIKNTGKKNTEKNKKPKMSKQENEILIDENAMVTDVEMGNIKNESKLAVATKKVKKMKRKSILMSNGNVDDANVINNILKKRRNSL